MTFASDLTRMLYHLLPAELQLEYVRIEELLAVTGREVRIESVLRDEQKLEIILRISEQLNPTI